MKGSIALMMAIVGAVLWLAASAPAHLLPEIEISGTLAPPLFEGCRGPLPWQSQWSPEVSGADREVHYRYECGGDSIHVFVAQFAEQSADAEALSEVQMILPPVWAQHSASSVVNVEGGSDVREYRLSAPGEELTVWAWYAIGSDRYPSRWLAKLAEIVDAALLQRRIAGILVVAGDGVSGAQQLSRVSPQLWSWYLADAMGSAS